MDDVDLNITTRVDGQLTFGLRGPIKLVIWDLDDTFWTGTLSEGDVELVEDNVVVVRERTAEA